MLENYFNALSFLTPPHPHFCKLFILHWSHYVSPLAFCILAEEYSFSSVYCYSLVWLLGPLEMFIVLTADPLFQLPGLALRKLDLQEVCVGGIQQSGSLLANCLQQLRCQMEVTSPQSCKVVDQPQRQRESETTCPTASKLVQSQGDQQVPPRSSLKLAHCPLGVHKSPQGSTLSRKPLHFIITDTWKSAHYWVSPGGPPTDGRSYTHPPGTPYHCTPGDVLLKISTWKMIEIRREGATSGGS